MDLDEEIHSHLKWQALVESMLVNTGGQYISPSLLIADNRCELGKWIYSDESNPFSHLHIFRHLVNIHREWHVKAGAILAISNNGNNEQASELRGELYALSQEIIKHLEKLKQYV